MFSAAALHCHLPFIFFAEASVKHFEIGYWKYPVQQIPILLWQGHGGILVPVIDGFNSCIEVLAASSCSKFHLHSFPIHKREYNVQEVVENLDTCFLPYPRVFINFCNSFLDWDDCSCFVFLQMFSYCHLSYCLLSTKYPNSLLLHLAFDICFWWGLTFFMQCLHCYWCFPIFSGESPAITISSILT